jgi:predicted dehydrogenase
MKRKNFSRRDFLARSLAGVAVAGLPEWFAKDAVAAERERLAGLPQRVGANDRIAFGCIGPGGTKGGYRQGLGDTRAARGQMGTQIVAVCDVDKQHREEAARIFGPDCAQYADFRELLARKDLDAVVIGTPDHWHTLIAIAAMRAGKDVYCEKPLTLTIAEGKALVKAQQETGRILQVGSQQRSDQRFRMACELVRNGRLGKLQKVTANLPNAPISDSYSPQPVPEGFDWDMWQGQTPAVEYMKERTHGTFRWWYEYSGGMVTDWGAHHLDIAQWGLGTDRSGPTHVVSKGVIPNVPNAYNVAHHFEITYTYPNGVTVFADHKGENGVKFEGEKGWIFVSRERIGASDPKLLEEPLPSDAVRLYVSNNHMGNFVDCVRSRKPPICDAEIGHRSVTVCHLGNISLRLGGRSLEWDPAREQFTGDDEANRMLSRPMRAPWRL